MNRLVIIFLASLVGFSSFVSGDAWAQTQVLLGERHVSDRSERDTINVGMKRGKFTGFRVKAEGAPIEFKRITVHFENGSKQTFEKNRILGRGDKSRKIDFDGGRRYVDRVVFFYEARTLGWKGAEVKLFGVR
ncbi:MAG: hypothetical protein HKO64_06785 [Xanthomonadales bacterium]|nr:hypothetical protein [Xanthomonadales bacterium]NNL95313.1 hypothetical protein [Xanthomonadales bacterium]